MSPRASFDSFETIPLVNSYPDIIDVKPSHDLRSSPALSTDRIETTYYKKGHRISTVLISPRDRDGVFKEIEFWRKTQFS